MTTLTGPTQCQSDHGSKVQFGTTKKRSQDKAKAQEAEARDVQDELFPGEAIQE